MPKHREKPFIMLLKHILKSYNMNQLDLAKELGVPQETISRWMSGRANPSHLAQNAIKWWLEKKSFSPSNGDK